MRRCCFPRATHRGTHMLTRCRVVVWGGVGPLCCGACRQSTEAGSRCPSCLLAWLAKPQAKRPRSATTSSQLGARMRCVCPWVMGAMAIRAPRRPQVCLMCVRDRSGWTSRTHPLHPGESAIKTSSRESVGCCSTRLQRDRPVAGVSPQLVACLSHSQAPVTTRWLLTMKSSAACSSAPGLASARRAGGSPRVPSTTSPNRNQSTLWKQTRYPRDPWRHHP